MKETIRVAVMGAGNGAHAIAGDLALRGFRVRLYNKFVDEIAGLSETGGVRVEGAVEGFGRLEQVTADPEPVVTWADVIMIVVPAFAHQAMAQACAPFARDGQVIVLNPGRTGGALEFRRALARLQVRRHVCVAEAQSLVFACRITGPARVHIAGVKARVPLAALPATETEAVLAAVRPLYPQFQRASSVLETSLDNVGAMFHPPATLLNAGRIDAGQAFEFYTQGITPAVARTIEAVDAERVAVGRAFGVNVTTAGEWLRQAYPDVRGATFHARISTNPAYQAIMAPSQLNVRYLTEDVPTGLVPIASLGELAGVPTPITRALADLAGVVVGRDFWATGRNAENLGLAGMGIEEIKAFTDFGF